MDDLRAFGAKAADRTLAILGRASHPRHRGAPDRWRGRLSRTDEIGQGALLARPRRRVRRRGEARAAHAVSRYGADAGRVLAFCRDGQDTPLADTGYTSRELRYLVRHEHARTLADIVQRRTSLAITGAVSSTAIAETAATLADELGCCAQQATDEERALPRASRPTITG